MCQIFQSLLKSRVNFKIPLTHLFLLFCFILLGLSKNKQTNKGFNMGDKDSHRSGDIDGHLVIFTGKVKLRCLRFDKAASQDTGQLEAGLTACAPPQCCMKFY